MLKTRRRWPRAVAASVVALLVLAGCSAPDSTPTLTWYINPDAGGQAKIAEQCTAQAGGKYRIQTSLLPNDASSQREQLARRLAAGDSSMDILSLDPPFVPELANPGFLAPVPESVVAKTTHDVVQGALDGAQWKGKFVTVPFWANTQILWYRKSVAAASGSDVSKPLTWDQLIESASQQQKLLAVQGARAESMTVWVNALIASAGGKIVENPDAPADQMRLGLDTEQGRQAAGVIGKIGRENLGGAGLPTMNESLSMALFQGDKGSYMVNYNFIWPATKAAVDEGSLPKSLLDDIGWGIYPRMSADRAAAPPLGGIDLGVGAKSKHPDLAYQAIECIVSPEHQTQYFLSDGNAPSNRAAFNDPQVLEQFPMAPVIRESLDLAVPRPQTPYYNEISSGIQQTWTPPSSVTEESTPPDSQKFIEAVLKGERLL